MKEIKENMFQSQNETLYQTSSSSIFFFRQDLMEHKLTEVPPGKHYKKNKAFHDDRSWKAITNYYGISDKLVNRIMTRNFFPLRYESNTII